MTRIPLGPLTVAAVALAALAACSAPAPSPSGSDDAVVVENCGFEVRFDAAPQRVITIKSTSTEMLLALGLGDRIIGTAFPDGPVPDAWAAAAADLLLISSGMPSEESVLDLEPDLVYSGWESAFSPEAAGERAELASLGIASYVQPAACRSQGAPTRLDFAEVFREIEEVATIFGVDADPLLDAQRAELAAVEPDPRGLSALWYSSGTDTPYVGAGTGAPQMILDAVGLRNIAADVSATWSSLSWEVIVEAEPDVIVLIDADWNTAESKIALLESNPATAALPAVQNRRYLILPFAASEAGVRSVSAATSLAEQLAALGAIDGR
jgi:iron complex transport system substrate-binding protein